MFHNILLIVSNIASAPIFTCSHWTKKEGVRRIDKIAPSSGIKVCFMTVVAVDFHT